MPSHRTSGLAEVPLPLRWLRELRYHEASRQCSGFLFIVLVGWLGSPSLLVWSLGAPLALAGILFRLWASGHVLKNKQLATDGPYAWVRHPLYTGNILTLVGFSLGSGLLWSWVLLALILIVFYPTAVEYEDRKLRGFFGPDWTRWASATPALLPRPPKARRRAAGEPGARWSFQKSLRQNGEPVIALFVGFLYAFLLTKAL